MSYKMIDRDLIYVGKIARVYTLKKNDDTNVKDKYIPIDYEQYRSIIFTIDKDGLCNDLLYDSPKYAVLNHTDNDIYWSNMLKENKHWGFEPKLVVIDAINIGMLLKKLGFGEQLTIDNIKYIKNVIFNKKILEGKCYQFGLVPTTSSKIIGWCNKGTDKEKYIIGPTKLYNEMKPYRDAINKFGSDKKISILKKGIQVNLDAFKPSRKEGKVKKKIYER